MAKPKLAVFSHYPGGSATILPLVRQTSDGQLEFGEDGVTIDVGDTINIRRLPGHRQIALIALLSSPQC